MASLLKSKNKSAVRKSNLVGGAVVGFVVLAFFFLPEILSLGGDKTSSSIESDSSITIAARPSPTQAIDALLEAKQQKQAEKKKQKTQSVVKKTRPTIQEVDGPRNDLVRVSSQKPAPSLADVQASLLQECVPCQQEAQLTEEEQTMLIPLKGPITWEHLARPEVKALLENVRGQSSALLGALPDRHQLSRFELFNFIKSVQTVEAGVHNGVFGPEEALKLADYSDSRVSELFLAEDVSRDFRRQWSEISISPLIREEFANRKKASIVGPFKPTVMISDVSMWHHWRQNPGEWRTAPIAAAITGYIVGEDISKLEFYIGKPSAYRVQLGTTEPDKKGRRFFYLEVPYFTGETLTINAYSNDEKLFSKLYNFPRTVKKKNFPVYRPPNAGEVHYRLPYGPLDPRLDRLFLVRQASADLGEERYLGANPHTQVNRF